MLEILRHQRLVPELLQHLPEYSPRPRCYFGQWYFHPPDSFEFLNQLGSDFTDFFAAKNFNWRCLAGAQVFTIGGLHASDYNDEIARIVSGNYLDHNVTGRVNRVVCNYRINGLVTLPDHCC